MAYLTRALNGPKIRISKFSSNKTNLVDYSIVDLGRNTHILINGFVINMDQKFELFLQQPAIGNYKFCFPPENSIKAKGPNYSNILLCIGDMTVFSSRK